MLAGDQGANDVH